MYIKNNKLAICFGLVIFSEIYHSFHYFLLHLQIDNKEFNQSKFKTNTFPTLKNIWTSFNKLQLQNKLRNFVHKLLFANNKSVEKNISTEYLSPIML